MNDEKLTLKIDDVGTKRWYNESNELHRTDGPAMIYSDGSKYWSKNGVYHRDDGPAFEDVYGTKIWYQYGKFHRIDGPAIEYADGTTSWYVRDQDINDWVSQQRISDNPTQEEQLIIRLTWG